MAATVLLAGVANAASLNQTVEPMEGETLAQFQSLAFPTIDRREIRISQGSGEFQLIDAHMLGQHEQIAIHFVNDTDKNAEINLPELNATFMVPAKTDRVYEFEANQIGFNQEIPYTVTTLYGPEPNYMAQSSELMRIINERVVIPTFAQDTEVSYNRTSSYKPQPQPAPSYNTGSSVRGFW